MGLYLPADVFKSVRNAFRGRGLFEETDSKEKRSPIYEIAYREHREGYEREQNLEVYGLAKATGRTVGELMSMPIMEYYTIMDIDREYNRRMRKATEKTDNNL